MTFNASPPNLTTPHHLTHFLNGTWTRHLTSLSLASTNPKQNAFQFERSLNSLIKISANGDKMSWAFGQSFSEDSFAYQMQVTVASPNIVNNNQNSSITPFSAQESTEDSESDQSTSQSSTGVLNISWVFQGQNCTGFYDNNLKIMQLTFHVHKISGNQKNQQQNQASFISVTYKFISESIANITMVEVDEKGKNSLLYGVMLKANE